MRTITKAAAVLSLCLLAAPAARGVPDSFFGNGGIFPIIPAHPVFGADLTREFLVRFAHEIRSSPPLRSGRSPISLPRDGGELDVAPQEDWILPGPWEVEAAMEGESVRAMTAMPVLFGNLPMAVRAHAEDGRLREIAITYLEAGAYFGFRLGGEKTRADREAGEVRRAEFASHHRRLSRDLRDRLEAGCGQGQMRVVGRSSLLRTVYTDFRWEDFVLRLSTGKEHAVELRLLRAGEMQEEFYEEEMVEVSEGERAARFAQQVRNNERGDVWVDGIPVYAQGNAPFCGIHSLAMAGRYYGLRARASDLAAGAELRNTGSSKGSKVFDLYHAVAEEVGMRARVSSRFDFDRVRRAIEEGRPVIVWRRVSIQREKAHAAFASSFAKNSELRLAEPTARDRESWPAREKKGSPSHASVVAGFNEERGEVILREPWGEQARERRVRIEELEATGYAVFFFRI